MSEKSQSDGKEMEQLASCLQDASRLVMGMIRPSTATTSAPETDHDGQTQTQRATAFHRVRSAVTNARGMMQRASSAGYFRRLNSSERLRSSTASATAQSRPAKCPKVEEPRPFEFVLMKFQEDATSKLLREDNVALRGFIQLLPSEKEAQIREKLGSAIQTQFPAVSGKDLCFLKANRRVLTNVVNNDGFDYKQIKLLSGQGAIYVTMKEGYNFLLSNDDINFSDDEVIEVEKSLTDLTECSSETNETANVNCRTSEHTADINPTDVSKAVMECTNYCRENDITEPTEVLRMAQKYIVQGRQLDLSSESELIEGETNFIIINRQDILKSLFEELPFLNNPQLTLEVSFYGETATDMGGPRREFLKLALQAVKEKYFDLGWREHLSDNYNTVGFLIALSILQNGPLPKFFSQVTLTEIFGETAGNECISQLRKGFEKLGIMSLVKAFPSFQYLFQPSSSDGLSLRKLLFLLQPKFDEEGSNNRVFQNEVYSAFVKYAREAAAGRRGPVDLSSILQFATCSSEEPTLGFSIKPSMEFKCATSAQKWSFLPSANTCVNQLYLIQPCDDIKMPAIEDLYEVFDTAFVNQYFGQN